MNRERYTVSIDAYSEIYEFESVGNKGVVRKRVTFRLIQSPDVYNLEFGDIDPLTDEIDDLAVTNNGDSRTGGSAKGIGHGSQHGFRIYKPQPRLFNICHG